jgi:hypothetical protein
MSRRLTTLVLAFFFVSFARLAGAATPRCTPCAGVRVGDPAALAAALQAGRPLPEDALFAVAWEVALDGTADPAPAAAVRAAGAQAWPSLVFTTPSPITEHLADLGRELEAAAAFARGAGPAARVQVVWRPGGEALPPTIDATDYAFFFKRAAVAVTGAQRDAEIVTQPLPSDPGLLERLWGEEIAAYVDVIALAPAAEAELEAAIARLAELDPGKPLVVDAIPYPAPPAVALAWAAGYAELGAATTLFSVADAAAADLDPLRTLASEFRGDLSFDPYSVPTGAESAWAFVRGEDLGLRVVASAPAGAPELVLRFGDAGLRRPTRVDLATGSAVPLAEPRRVESGSEVRVPEPGPVTVLRLERPTVAELAGAQGVEERLTVAGERTLPVEEILRRLQAFDDAQARRVHTYRALNTTHLRFRVGGAAQGVEATFAGPFFFRQGEGFDWAWRDFFINGVRWRGKTIPEIPLVQPEKAAAMPLEILFTREYRYTLRGTAEVEGRPTWVVDFEPAGPAEGKRLHQGTVWIDRELYARVKTRALQLGLEGEVLSNEETISYSPVDEAGRPSPWRAESFWLPLRLVGRQLLSVVDSTTLVERETFLTEVRVNDADFAAARREVLASDATMVRDTAKGLRYLVKQEDGERVVKEGFDRDKLFALAGLFYDDALDFPLPLGGINYFSFDFRGTGKQLNVFFAGALLTASVSDPDVRGSRFDAGADLFAIAFPFTDTLFRDDREVPGEEVQVRPASVGLSLGRPIGNFFKADLEYQLSSANYGGTDETDSAFVVPTDTLTHTFSLQTKLSRGGYELEASGSLSRRAEWEPWGLPGSDDFDPEHREYAQWRASLGKTWPLRGFQRLGAEVDYLGGRDLDRFSKYQFGFFGAGRVHGYQSGRVRASEAWASHLSYGFGIGDTFRIDAVGDAAWATDDESGLENELLAGVGVAGTFMGPWQTVVNLDVGVPVAGPDDGFTLYVVFLKLFR